jgi:uncharacterized Zn-binding protein involved in type VI secretion
VSIGRFDFVNSHVGQIWRSRDSGQTWTAIDLAPDAGRFSPQSLPNVPARSIIFDPDAARPTLYVGTDVGVYRGEYQQLLDGWFWTPMNDGMPMVRVTDLELRSYRDGSRYLAAGTYGRGAYLWQLQAAQPPAPGNPPIPEGHAPPNPGFYFGTFTAPSGASSFTVTIAWGDGQSSPGSASPIPGTNTWKVTGSHTYAEDNHYNAEAKVTPVGGSDTITLDTTITVIDAAVTIISNPPISGTVGASSSLVATFVDDTLTGLPSDFSAWITWGDGSPPSGGTITPDPYLVGFYNVTGSHTYWTAGSFPVTLTIKDEDGNTASTSNTASISGLTAQVDDFTVTEGASLLGITVASFTPSGPGPDSATIDWGDGYSDTGNIVPNGTSYLVQGNHTYAEEKTRHTTVTITHGAAKATVNGTATVTDASLTANGQTLNATAGKRVSANRSRTVDCAHADKCQYMPNRPISPGSPGWATDSPLPGSAVDWSAPSAAA